VLALRLRENCVALASQLRCAFVALVLRLFALLLRLRCDCDVIALRLCLRSDCDHVALLLRFCCACDMIAMCVRCACVCVAIAIAFDGFAMIFHALWLHIDCLSIAYRLLSDCLAMAERFLLDRV
jgi:hypothetical protein